MLFGISFARATTNCAYLLLLGSLNLYLFWFALVFNEFGSFDSNDSFDLLPGLLEVNLVRIVNCLLIFIVVIETVIVSELLINLIIIPIVLKNAIS